MEPLVEATVQSFTTLRRDLHSGLAGVSAETLNHRPYPDGNTISGLIAHMYDSGNFLLHHGLARPFDRQREAQFAVTMPDADALLAHVDRCTENLIALAKSYTADDLARHGDFRGTDTVGAWYLLHACEHLLEHWGQIQTMRDMAARG